MRRASDKQEQILFRRARITELHSKGLRTDRAIAEELGCSRQTVNSDIKVLRRKYDKEIKTGTETKLAYEYATIMAGVWLLLKMNWEVLENAESSYYARADANRTILKCYKEIQAYKISFLFGYLSIRCIYNCGTFFDNCQTIDNLVWHDIFISRKMV
jgi:DNA-binding CsgD family transcriptional regulator